MEEKILSMFLSASLMVAVTSCGSVGTPQSVPVAPQNGDTAVVKTLEFIADNHGGKPMAMDQAKVMIQDQGEFKTKQLALPGLPGLPGLPSGVDPSTTTPSGATVSGGEVNYDQASLSLNCTTTTGGVSQTKNLAVSKGDLVTLINRGPSGQDYVLACDLIANNSIKIGEMRTPRRYGSSNPLLPGFAAVGTRQQSVPVSADQGQLTIPKVDPRPVESVIPGASMDLAANQVLTISPSGEVRNGTSMTITVRTVPGSMFTLFSSNGLGWASTPNSADGTGLWSATYILSEQVGKTIEYWIKDLNGIESKHVSFTVVG